MQDYARGSEAVRDRHWLCGNLTWFKRRQDAGVLDRANMQTIARSAVDDLPQLRGMEGPRALPLHSIHSVKLCSGIDEHANLR